MSIPGTEVLICQDCGESFSKGKSKSGYKAKFCPDCRGRHVGKPSNVSALPAPASIPDDWYAGPEVTKAEITSLGRKLAFHILKDKELSIDHKLSVLRIAGRWDQDADTDMGKLEELRNLMQLTRGGRAQ